MHTTSRSLGWPTIVAMSFALGACSSSGHDIRVSNVPPGPPGTLPAREVVLVGNNWVGTVVAFSPDPPFEVLGTFDVVPDRAFLDNEVEHSVSRKTDMALILERYDMREETKEFGQPWKDSAVRPMAITPDDKIVFVQLSFLHGFYEFDLEKKRITRMKVLPGAEELDKLDPREFQLNSADHGITLNGDGTRLCVAGTMTGMAYVVRRDTFDVKTIDLHDKQRPEVKPKPYWSTTSADGKHCYVSLSGLDRVVVISFEDEAIVGTVNVGTHPQRIRNGHILVSALSGSPRP